MVESLKKEKPYILECIDVSHTYQKGKRERVEVLRGANIKVGRSEIVALSAPTGIGKSTLLNIAGLLITPSKGRVIVNNQRCESGVSLRNNIRGKHLGIIYQFHHLMADFKVIENVTMPLLVKGKNLKESKKKALVLLERLGLLHRIDHYPSQLSGGEKQRVAVCRALISAPDLIIADEPTGNLDLETGKDVFEFLISDIRERKTAMIVATHAQELLGYVDKIVTLVDGQVVEVS